MPVLGYCSPTCSDLPGQRVMQSKTSPKVQTAELHKCRVFLYFKEYLVLLLVLFYTYGCGCALLFLPCSNSSYFNTAC